MLRFYRVFVVRMVAVVTNSEDHHLKQYYGHLSAHGPKFNKRALAEMIFWVQLRIGTYKWLSQLLRQIVF